MKIYKHFHIKTTFFMISMLFYKMHSFSFNTTMNPISKTSTNNFIHLYINSRNLSIIACFNLAIVFSLMP